jgi:cholesterol transport system auxiliary component
MLAPLLLRALQRTGEFRAVLLAPTSAASDLRLETELVRLQHDFTVRPSQVRLTLSAVLVDAHTRQVIAAQSFDEAATGGDDPVTGVAAAQHVAVRALAALAAACGRWARAREGH